MDAELAKPDVDAQLEAWLMDDDTETDMRKPHRRSPNVAVSVRELHALGVLTWHLDADNLETDPRLAAIRKTRGYSYEDRVTVSPAAMGDAYASKLAIFCTEHLHSDEEIRFVLDGSGYFDVRDGADRWVRIATRKGDMIVLPEGIYHRFTTDEGDYIKAMRLFVGDPVWTPINRGAEADLHPARAAYRSNFVAVA